MNKKFSTLVAALLASGGLFYAVDAMILPASNGVAKTYLAAVAQGDVTGTIVGYTLSATDYSADMTADWSLESATDGKFYLQIGEGFYLNNDLKVQKGKEGAAEYTIAGGVIEGLFIENGALAATGTTPAGLFTVADGAIASSAAAETKYLLGGVVYGDAALDELTATSSILKMAKAEETAVAIAKLENTSGINFTPTIQLEVLPSGNFVMKAADKYVKVTSEGAISYEVKAPDNAESFVTLGSEGNASKVMFGEKYLKIEDAAISVVEAANVAQAKAYLVEGNISSASATAATKLDASKTYCLVSQESKGTMAENDHSVTFTAAKDAVYEGTEIGSTAVEAFGQLDAASKFSTVASSGDLKLGSDFVTWTANGPVLGSTGTNYLLQEDGSFAYAGNKLTLDGEILYAYSAKGAIYTNKAAAGSNLALSAKSETTPVNKLTGKKVIVATATIAATNVPGADVEGMGDEVTVKENGTIELIAGVSSVSAIPAPFTVKASDGNYLGVAGWDKTPASWILESGKLKNLAAEKAGEKKMYLGAAQAKAAANYSLVEKANALTVSYNAEGELAIDGTAVKATLTTTGEALDLVVKDQLTSVSSGAIVTIQDATYKTAKPYKIVIGAMANGNFNYSFVECDEHGKEVIPTTYLKYNNETDFIGQKYEKTFSLTSKDGDALKINTGGTAFEKADNQTSLTLLAYAAEADPVSFKIGQLLNDFGSRISFGVALEHKYKDENGDAATKAITTGNVFADADLVPVKYNSTAADGKKLVVLNGDDNASADEATLLKSGDRYIVMEITKGSEWTSIKEDLKEGGYKFTTLGEKAMLEILANGGKLNAGKSNETTYAPYFQFFYNNVTNENGKGKAVYNIEVTNVNKAAIDGTKLYVSSFEVKTGTLKGVYLTAAHDEAYWVAAELGLNNQVKAKSDNSPLNYKYVNIEFANHSSIKDNSGKVINSRVPNANANGTGDKSEFLFNKPEGQWSVNVAGHEGELDKKGVPNQKDATSFTFKNRESGKTFTVSAMYYLGDNKYAVAYVNSDKFAASPATRDTMIIKGIEADLKYNTVQRDGYADLKALDVQDEQFRLLVASTEEDYYVGENHSAKSHFLGLSHDENAAVNWRIVPLTATREYDKDGIIKNASDSVYVFNHSQYFGADNKLFSNNDTIAIVSYALQNTANGEYLTYEAPQTTTIQSMICDPNFKSFKTTKDVKAAYRFVLKEKANGLYNIVSIDKDRTYTDGYLSKDQNPYFELGGNKLYGATTLTKQGAVEVEEIYTQINSNDLFKVEKIAAPEYRKLAQGDTIRIFREENNFDTMYENGEFLNLGNTAQLKEMAPALYVDTAYVTRGTNNRYQYLLVVNPDRVDQEKCNHKPADHPLIHPDTTYGRFLVNLVDSAVIAYKNGAIHANKYINDVEADEPFVKLGFVWGYRTGDKLYLTEGQDFTKVKDQIELGNSDFNIAKFAFRYTNPTNADDQSFKIQTRYVDYNVAKDAAKKADWEESNDGYLKTINGVVVVTKGYAKGEEFNLAAEKSNPTANDEISASAISVVATDGAVIIKGAEGKNVVITNVLGQTIANTVITSSETTISAPAGVVVVAVEGEAAVKAIVK
ncbi:DUF6383 domain-containing protein [uncultured Parabacteroides sp.]|uniref:DUF6383 domain-containing protein n=1 Tax=uncultured Parabacteroides sp. TaxID=512312 RepID=UPI002587389D|nr:DUF6383 domain-containing protein [uncultured Parabacteroides sp.]